MIAFTTLLLLALLLAFAQARTLSREIDLAAIETNYIKALTLEGAADDTLGLSVSGAGDVNGDGFDDLFVGAPFADPEGRSSAGLVYVSFGNKSGFAAWDTLNFNKSTGYVIQGAAAGDNLGYSVSGAGDVNNDFYADVIIGATGADPNSRSDAGVAYVIFGMPGGFATLDLLGFVSSDTTGYMIQGAGEDHNVGTSTDDNLGYSVAGAGDVNGDGYADVIVGAPKADPNLRFRAGAAYVVFGKPSGFGTVDTLNAFSGFEIQGGASNNHLGTSVSGAGDVNNDGYADVIVGVEWAHSNGAYEAGAAFVFFGKKDGFATIDLDGFTSSDSGFLVLGAAAGDNLGTSVSGAGDVNNDGFDDVLVGAPNQGDNRYASGAVYLFFGKAAGFATLDTSNFTSSDGYIIQGAAEYDRLGRSVSAAEDVNGDGYADVVVGAPEVSVRVTEYSRSKAGAAYVIFGMPGGFTTLDLAGFTSSESTGYIIWVCMCMCVY
jgi:hypothetical protein